MPVQFIACKSSGLLVGVECADDNGADNDGGNGDYDSIDKVCVCVCVFVMLCGENHMPPGVFGAKGEGACLCGVFMS